MDLRKSFNENPANYDKYRPGYCDALFRDIIEYAELSPQKECLEIGCGTGQATKPILDIGCSVLAVELGGNLAEYTKNKFKSNENFKIENADFEKYELQADRYDLVFSGTAFHWIQASIGYPKVYNVLKRSGTAAFFWNNVTPENFEGPLHIKMQQAYQKYYDSNSNKKALDEHNNLQNRIIQTSNTIKQYGFVDVKYNIYKQTRVFSADDYISLLNTYSDHSTMPEPTKSQFFMEIRDTILEFGNSITLFDTMDLHLARKP